MEIKEILSPSEVVVDLRAGDKSSLLDQLARRAAAALGLSADLVSNEILKRDELGSTGIGAGVAVPHARLREIKRPFGILAHLKDPMEFDAIDGEPVDIVFLLMLPARFQLDQLNALAAVARKLRDQDVVRRIRGAKSAAELFAAIAK
jgi:PTS system nitrogen regulatory IIA component